MSSSQQKSTMMGTSPFIIGMPRSCKGREARSAIRAASMNSDSSISPNCRLPSRRMVMSREKYTITVRMIIIAMAIVYP